MSEPAITIFSGGQTGVDRAALDFAREHNFLHGGWCPRGRMAEDGPIDPRYQLHETFTSNYAERTEKNIQQSDATVVFSPAREATGGTRLTLELAHRAKKPLLHLVQGDQNQPGRVTACAAALRGFMGVYRVRTLNVAGPRASQSPEMARFARAVLIAALSPLSATNSSAAMVP